MIKNLSINKMHRWQHVRSSMENDSVLFRTRLSKRDSFCLFFCQASVRNDKKCLFSGPVSRLRTGKVSISFPFMIIILSGLRFPDSRPPLTSTIHWKTSFSFFIFLFCFSLTKKRNFSDGISASFIGLSFKIRAIQKHSAKLRENNNVFFKGNFNFVTVENHE